MKQLVCFVFRNKIKVVGTDTLKKTTFAAHKTKSWLFVMINSAKQFIS